MGRDLSDARTPYLWLDATYVKCRREGRVASTAVVTAIGCDEGGWRRVLGLLCFVKQIFRNSSSDSFGSQRESFSDFTKGRGA